MILFFYDKVAWLAGIIADALSRPFLVVERWAYNHWRDTERHAEAQRKLEDVHVVMRILPIEYVDAAENDVNRRGNPFTREGE